MIRRLRFCVMAVTAASLGGCGGKQSILDPAGPQAVQLAQVSGLLFAVGLLILLVVVLAVLCAIRGPARLRALLAAARTVVWAGIAFPVVTLTALLGYGIWLTRAEAVLPQDPNTIRIAVAGEQWWWRVSYAHGDRTIVTANEIRIPTESTILFSLTSADVIHSFWVPNLGGKVDMIPGRTTHLRLRADRAGIFRGQCAEYCGGPHALMALEVVAQPPAEFEAWIAGQAAPAAEPHSPAARRGRDVFLAAGCGACHSIRGTPAAGTIGPDLTHLASRRSIGADTLAMTEANIKRFIVEGQHVKPGNLMPPFRIFASGDLDALASYLAGLQ